jgi:hypothetical protein
MNTCACFVSVGDEWSRAEGRYPHDRLDDETITLCSDRELAVSRQSADAFDARQLAMTNAVVIGFAPRCVCTPAEHSERGPP